MTKNFHTYFNRRAFLQSTAIATAASATAFSFAQNASSPVAETTAGKVRGTRNGRINIFKGIPYGADTGTTRFMPPAEPTPWTGERDAANYGKRTPQVAGAPREGANILSSWAIPQEMGEDCLFVNVWTPGLRDGRKRPVMLWIHGGGFTSGSGAANAYEGTNLATRGDVVVVTVNHRLNIFGYLYLGEFDARYADSGNVGQHDLIAALRWVKNNIEEFGGDPDNVMIFGESGGGAKICALLAMPQAKGLFHRAAIQSGPMVRGVEKNVAVETAEQALAALNIKLNELDKLNAVTTEQLLGAYGKLTESGRFRSLAPVVDGRGLPRHPFEPDAPAVSADVPIIIGYNRTETTFVLSGDPTNFTLTWEQLPERLLPHIGKLDPGKVVADFRQLLPQATASDIFFEVTTQIMMTRNVTLIADRKARQNAGKVFVYQVNWETPIDGGKWQAPHTLEIPMVFDNIASSPSLYGTDPATLKEAQAMALQMSEAWISFARTGNPNSPHVRAWPAYDTKRRGTLIVDLDSHIVDHPSGAGARILEGAPYWDLTT